MDMTAQLKKNLISRIKDSKDLNFLKALQTIFDSSEQALFEVSSMQEQSIEKGRKQIAKGEFTSHEQVISEMRTWLKK
jgi:predicted transcriptional regulator